jgi:hypothetical protein
MVMDRLVLAAAPVAPVFPRLISLAPSTSMFINWISHMYDFTCGYRGLVFTLSVPSQVYAIILCGC